MDVLYLVMLMYVYDELALWITRSMHNTYYLLLVVLIITNSLVCMECVKYVIEINYYYYYFDMMCELVDYCLDERGVFILHDS